MELHELIARIEDAGIRVSWTKLETCNAGWDAAARTIWMDVSLIGTPRRARSILCHEWAHAILGHEGPQSPAGEARADRLAARLLICPGRYRRAERMYGPDVHALAVELGVTTRLIEAYRLELARAA